MPLGKKITSLLKVSLLVRIQEGLAKEENEGIRAYVEEQKNSEGLKAIFDKIEKRTEDKRVRTATREAGGKEREEE